MTKKKAAKTTSRLTPAPESLQEWIEVANLDSEVRAGHRHSQPQDFSKGNPRLKLVGEDQAKEAAKTLRAIARVEGWLLGVLQKIGPLEMDMVIAPDGRIRITPDPFMASFYAALQEDGVDATRIRECRNCNRIFWAGRKDKFECSEKCSRLMRLRRWRRKYPEKYKLQRIRKAELEEQKRGKSARTQEKEKNQ